MLLEIMTYLFPSYGQFLLVQWSLFKELFLKYIVRKKNSELILLVEKKYYVDTLMQMGKKSMLLQGKML